MLTMNLKLTTDKCILTNEFNDRFIFERFILSKERLYVRPMI